jgi:hypothetical protein
MRPEACELPIPLNESENGDGVIAKEALLPIRHVLIGILVAVTGALYSLNYRLGIQIIVS